MTTFTVLYAPIIAVTMPTRHSFYAHMVAAYQSGGADNGAIMVWIAGIVFAEFCFVLRIIVDALLCFAGDREVSGAKCQIALKSRRIIGTIIFQPLDKR